MKPEMEDVENPILKEFINKARNQEIECVRHLFTISSINRKFMERFLLYLFKNDIVSLDFLKTAARSSESSSVLIESFVSSADYAEKSKALCT